MGLTAILEVVRRTEADQVKAIEQRAVEQAGQISAEAEPEAEQAREEARLKEVMPAHKERARIIHHARLESLRLTGNVREALIDAVLNQARGHLAGLRSDPEYPPVLARLTREALEALQGSVAGARLEADPRDRTLLEGILDQLDARPAVIYGLECWGGVIAKSGDERVIVLNTLESRLEQAGPYLRRHLAAWFESNKHERLRLW